MDSKDEPASYEMSIPVQDIIRMMGICRSKFELKHKNRMYAAGAIFKVRNGNPPRERIRGFPSRIRQYIGLIASEGETL